MTLDMFEQARNKLFKDKADTQAKQFLAYMFDTDYSDVDMGGYDEWKDTQHNNEIEQRNLSL